MVLYMIIGELQPYYTIIHGPAISIWTYTICMYQGLYPPWTMWNTVPYFHQPCEILYHINPVGACKFIIFVLYDDHCFMKKTVDIQTILSVFLYLWSYCTCKMSELAMLIMNGELCKVICGLEFGHGEWPCCSISTSAITSASRRQGRGAWALDEAFLTACGKPVESWRTYCGWVWTEGEWKSWENAGKIMGNCWFHE